MTDSQRPLLFDAHAHLVADDQQAYPRNPMQRAANAPYRAPGVIGKPGGHHGPNPINEIPDVSRMLTWMQAQNVDGAVAVQKRMIYRYDNSYIQCMYGLGHRVPVPAGMFPPEARPASPAPASSAPPPPPAGNPPPPPPGVR